MIVTNHRTFKAELRRHIEIDVCESLQRLAAVLEIVDCTLKTAADIYVRWRRELFQRDRGSAELSVGSGRHVHRRQQKCALLEIIRGRGKATTDQRIHK